MIASAAPAAIAACPVAALVAPQRARRRRTAVDRLRERAAGGLQPREAQRSGRQRRALAGAAQRRPRRDPPRTSPAAAPSAIAAIAPSSPASGYSTSAPPTMTPFSSG